nr:MAG TPA: hypothetical protein [Caudoviricetes sp.]
MTDILDSRKVYNSYFSFLKQSSRYYRAKRYRQNGGAFFRTKK